MLRSCGGFGFESDNPIKITGIPNREPDLTVEEKTFR